jgi:hypothetical protein
MSTPVDVAHAVDLGGEDLFIRNLYTGNTSPGQASPTSSSTIVPGGSTIILTSGQAGRQINLDTASGTTATLPAATGTGNLYRFVVTVLATSNSHIIQTASGSDNFQGIIYSTLVGTPTTNNGWVAAADVDTITLNRTTTGSASLGEWINCRDIALNVWQVDGVITQTGTAATPFSDVN